MDGGADLLRGIGRDARQYAAHRMGKRHVRDKPVAEEGADPTLRPIEKLVGHEHVEWPVLFLQASDRARRKNTLHTEPLEPVDVGAEVQLGWQQPMPGSVPREK